MRIMLLDQEVYNGKDRSSLKEVFEKVYKMLEENGQIFSHITVDGVDIYDEPVDYLIERGEEVECIEIQTVTAEKFRVDILFSVQEYVDRAVLELENLSGEFYEGATDESWIKLGQLLEGIQWLEKAANFLSTSHSNVNCQSFISQSMYFGNEMKMLNDAVTQQDLILIGDVLKHELYPRFRSIQQEITLILKNEVQSDVIN